MQKSNNVLQDKIILIAGNAGSIQHGIIKSFLSEGAIVIAPAASFSDITALRNCVGAVTQGTLITQLIDVPDYDKVHAFTEAIMEKFGRIDIAVSALACTANAGKLTEVTMEAWQKMVDTDIFLFYVFARITLPLLKKRPGALFVSVCNSQINTSPEQAGLAKLAETARTGMSQILSEEAQENYTRYYHLGVQHSYTEHEFGEPGPAESINNSSLIGSRIIQLYTQKTEAAKEVFQFFPMVHSSYNA